MTNQHFTERLTKLKVRPVLMTSQLMDSGSFILHDALEKWLRAGSRNALLAGAAAAYARNQKIKGSAARRVFTELE